MVTVYDVPPSLLIEALSRHLKDGYARSVKPPLEAAIVKTGPHKQLPPQGGDWWYVRCAAILRKLYMHGPVGVGGLRTSFGGRERRGVRREHFKKCGGGLLREALHQLEEAGLVAKKGVEGRVLTSEGRSLLDRVAGEVFKELRRSMPELRKYA